MPRIYLYTKLPNFSIPDLNGELVDLNTLLLAGPVYLVLNRGFA